jgi:hypothetical protein
MQYINIQNFTFTGHNTELKNTTPLPYTIPPNQTVTALNRTEPTQYKA